MKRFRKEMVKPGGVLIRRRRVDLSTLRGTLRESGRVYRDFVNGVITMEAAEVRSRVLGRHKEILSSMEQQRQLAELLNQLKALHGGAITFDPELET